MEMKINLNKQQENIEDIIALEATEEIVYIFLDHVLNSDKTIGLIANKELVEYAMGESLMVDGINVRKVDIEKDDLEYMISIDNNGDIVVQPIEYYNDKFFNAMDYIYISMDGDVDQLTIDMCLDRDITITLFGYENEPCECDGRCEYNKELAIESDCDMHGFSVNYSDESGYSSYSFYSTDMDLVERVAMLFI